MNVEASHDAPPGRQTRAGGGRAFHSRLEPFVDFIREQRQRRRTWKEIAESLRAEKGCAITFQGLHQFYRRYVARQARPHWERETTPAPVGSQPVKPSRNAPQASTPSERPFRKPPSDGIQLNDPSNV